LHKKAIFDAVLEDELLEDQHLGGKTVEAAAGGVEEEEFQGRQEARVGALGEKVDVETGGDASVNLNFVAKIVVVEVVAGGTDDANEVAARVVEA
jgi:hypothetical protein